MMSKLLADIEYKTAEPIDVPMMKQAGQLQQTIWGNEAVTAFPEMMAIIRNGGCLLVAYHREQAVGFSYSFPGYSAAAGKAYLCSHMLGILPEYRDRGIGMRLKLEQRQWAIRNGYEKIVWTYDPLESRNAYLNVYKLGGTAASYVESYYGESRRGIPMDRLVLEWDLQSSRVIGALDGRKPAVPDAEGLSKLVSITAQGAPEKHSFEAGQQGYRVAVPPSIQLLLRENPELAKEWRFALREALVPLLKAGYRITGLQRDGESIHYVIEREAGCTS
ncbi:GNAT family N-acetyltransferase [Paenibacillus sp. NPDC056579]|uniref:GNAT family N-acetyltransferase n=1 Tax=Paenibacillus sp. NPDC056579 TaxID=3345871 RepID=UPI0036B8D2E3